MNNRDKIEALKRQLILHPSYLTIIEEIEKDLERLESLERQNEVLKRDLKKYQAYIKKGVEEHYEDFMSDYDLLLQENHELNKKLEILERIKKEAIIQEHYKKGYGRYYTAGIEEFFNKIKEWLEID